jgi:hypothetical protein
VFLDCESAFDAVGSNGLKYKIYEIGKDSRFVYLKAGTPQGSSLSPILYIIFVNDLPPTSPHQVDPSQFADDIGLWTSSALPKTAEIQMQKALDLISNWCNKWRINLSAEKTKVLLFTRCLTHKRVPPSLQLSGNQLQISDETDFRGVKFNSSMT